MLKSSILVVDDEAGVRSALTGVLRDESYDVEAVASGEACLTAVTRKPFDMILLDVWLPGIDGLTTLSRLRERRVDAEVEILDVQHRRGVGDPALHRDGQCVRPAD